MPSPRSPSTRRDVILATVRVGEGPDATATEVTWLADRTESITISADLPASSEVDRIEFSITLEGAEGDRMWESLATTACEVPLECLSDCETPPLVEASIDCQGDRGVLALAVTNNNERDRKYTARTGQSQKVLVLAAGTTGEIKFTGRPEGPIAWTTHISPGVGRFNDVEGTVNAECTPTDDARIVGVSCLAENGRVDVEVRTPIGAGTSRLATVVFGNLTPRERSINSDGEWRRFTATGRKDGPLAIRVFIEGRTVLDETVEIDCDPEPTEEVVVTQSCLAGRGRVDVALANLGDAPAYYEVLVGRILRTRVLAPGATVNVAVTGRPIGPLDVVVDREGTSINTTPLVIDC